MSPSTKDRLAQLPLATSAVLATVLLTLMTFWLVIESMPALRELGLSRWVMDDAWLPTAVAVDGQFAIWAMALGTLLSTIGAILIAAPLGLLCAVFCRHYAPRPLAVILRRVIELLAGIPSVVFGLWGLVVMVPLVALLAPPGASLFSAMMILALMILPTVALLSDAALGAVPAELHRAAAALGLSRARTIWFAILPAARGGVISAVLLATCRALGETMAVLMVCGNVVQAPDSLFAPVRTLTANIALEMAYAMGSHRSALFVSGLLLAIVVAVLVTLSRRMSPEPQHA